MSASRSDVIAACERIVSDPVRGRRVVHEDASGRPIAVVRADGSRVHLEYDTEGRLRRADAGDAVIEVDRSASGGTRIHDRESFTDIDVSPSGWSIGRRHDWLRVETDDEGRPVFIGIPGSPLPLRVEYSGRGVSLRCGTRLLARLATADGCRRWRIGSTRIEERHEGLRTTITASDIETRRRLSVVVWTDLAGRTVRRIWNDGFEEHFRRDAFGRLASHRQRRAADGEWENRDFRYRGTELVEERTGHGFVHREVDIAGRVTTLTRSDGGTIRYTYDVRGRRTTRIAPDGITRYCYDGFDRLVRVDRADGSFVESRYDGLGRRVETRGRDGIRFEHRDAGGRLWAITDEHGSVLATFVWFENCPLIHFQGPLGVDAFVAYAFDSLGSPLIAVRGSGTIGAHIARAVSPPFGACPDTTRPTIYGHFGDHRSGLIHFGARELDPEIGLFLTPEPWHGAADDERRWTGPSPEPVGPVQEGLGGRHHAYALCRFDPVGRADYDGHMSLGKIVRGLGNILLGPTWGMPLTSLSLGFLLPLNIYMEIVAGIIFIFIKRHPWKNHSIFGSPLMLASGRQAQLSFGLGGFWPRVIAGKAISSDRAVTIGNVVWITRRSLNVLDRPFVVDLEDISGAGGALTALNADPNKKSLVGLEIKGDAGKIKTHLTFWTRGYGNAIKSVGAPPKLAFDDRLVGGKRFGTIVLAHPVPFGYDAPSSPGGARMVVREFVHDPGTSNASTATLLDHPFFVLKLTQDSKEKLKANDPITIEAKNIDAAHMVIGKIEDHDGFSLVFLFGELPARFQAPPITTGMVVRRLVDDPSRSATPGWADIGGPTTLELSKPVVPVGGDPKVILKDWPPPLRTTDIVKITATTAAAPTPTVGFPNPSPVNDAHARILRMVASVQVTEPVTAATFPAATNVFLMSAKGKVQKATLKDPAKPSEFEFAASPGVSANDYVSIHTAGGADTFAKITNLAGKVATISYLATVPAYAGPTDLDVQKVVDRIDTDHPKGSANAPSGLGFDLEVPRFSALVAGAVVRLAAVGAAGEEIRKLADVTKVVIHLTDPAIGTKPFTVGLAKCDPKLCRIKNEVSLPKLKRFLKHTGGAVPSAYGQYPIATISLHIQPAAAVAELATSFFVRPPAAAPNFDDAYKLTWSPLQFGGDNWFVLDSDLPISDGVPATWQFDPDDPEENRRAAFPPPPAGGYTFDVKEFTASAAVRGLGDAVSAHAAEVLVPADPRVRHTLGKALQEHEQRHTVQGNYFGPFLGNAPLTGLVDMAGVDQPDWFKKAFNDETGFKGYEAISLAGLLFGAWKLFWPEFVFKDARDTILGSNFEGLNRRFNPLWSYIVSKVPDIDIDHDITGDGFLTGLARFIARATDLRFWTPGLGFVPLWYPDSGQNTLEQDASRESGDLYTTILTTDGGFNAKLRSRLLDLIRDDHDADVEKPLGSLFRLMMYPANRYERIFRVGRADEPVGDLPVVYNDEASERDFVTISAPADTLFHPDLYDITPAPATLAIDGPTSNPAPVNFLKFTAGGLARPTLRNLVPMPPRVNRTAGFYFIPSQPAVYDCKAHESHAGDPAEDALTQDVKLTVSGTVSLASDVVAWQTPPAAGTVPAGPTVDRFVTEIASLTMKSGKDVLATDGFEERLDVAGAAAPNAKISKNNKDWTIDVGDTPTSLRVRLYRIIKQNDFNNPGNNERAFDLTFPDVPTLTNVRSYLDKNLWIPVRDFLINVQALPPLANVAKTSDQFEDVDLPLEVDVAAIVITPPARAPRFPTPSKRGASATFPRGRIWRFGPLDKTIEDPVVYRVEVTFGKAPATARGAFDLTVNPTIALQAAGGGAFEATTATELVLTINGGTAPYTLKTENKPADTDVTPDFVNLRITVKVNTAPPAPQQVVVIVKDSKGKEGRRTVTVR